jgi:hypothetical protein
MWSSTLRPFVVARDCTFIALRPFIVAAFISLALFQLYLGHRAHTFTAGSPWLLRRHGAGNAPLEHTPRAGCHIAIVSTHVPQRCGIAEFSGKLIAAMRQSTQFQDSCSLEVYALVSTRIVKNTSLWLPDRDDPAVPVTYIKMDKRTPSKAIWAAVQRMHQQRVTHCVLQQEYGLTPTMWQLADLARWLPTSVSLVTVVHSPRSHPNIEELGLIRRWAARGSACGVACTTMHYHALQCMHCRASVASPVLQGSVSIFVRGGVSVLFVLYTYNVYIVCWKRV